jgi:hypothetical protein
VYGDALPIRIDATTGPVIAHIQEGDDGAVRAAVIDMLSPLTRLQSADGAPPTRRCTDLTLLGDGPALDPTALVARAHLDLTITAMPCPTGGCQVGTGAATTAVGAIIGGDAFDTAAVRFDFSRGEMTLFPDIAGDVTARGRLCEAQVDRPFRGGGSLLLGGTEVSFPARRIAVGACLSYEDRFPQDGDIEERGADVELVVSTGIGPTILSASAYERWRATFDDATRPPASDTLPTGSLWLATYQIAGRVGTIDRIALVGRDDDNRGPCRQVYAHHLLSVRDCTSSDRCPCNSGERRCSVPSVFELAPATPIAVLIVADDDPTLQALRAELRPETAEIDGILGTAALAATSIDVDPPDNRLLLRCEGAGCISRPALITSGDRKTVTTCLERAGAI